jgi:hypothetical protein
VWNLLFIGSYGINTDVIHLLALFEHQCCEHCLDTNLICMFVLFRHECCVSIHIVYTQKLCTRLLCLNNAWHSCLNNTNPWNNKFCMDLEWTHEAYKFVTSRELKVTYALFAIGSSLEDVLLAKLHSPCREGPNEEEIQWVIGKFCNVMLSIPWDIFKSLLWFIWSQKCEQDLKEGHFHLSIVMFWTWQTTIKVGIVAWKELHKFKISIEKQGL